MLINFRTEQPSHSPLGIDNSAKVVFSSIKLTDSLDWSRNTSSLLKQAQQLLDFLRWIRRAHLSPSIFNHFYQGTIETMLTSWSSGLRVTGAHTKTCCREYLWNLSSIKPGCHTQTQSQLSITGDFANPHHALFFLLPS